MFTDGRTDRRTDGRTPGSSLYPRTFRSGDKKKIALNFPKSAAMDFFQGPQERVRNSQGKRAIRVRAIEVLLYSS